MGYDVDRFLEAVNEGLLCCICRDVLEDPVQSHCEHAYCRTCIEAWLVHETTCPEDRKPLSLSGLKTLFRYMKNDLNRLQIRCECFRNGCQYIGDLEFIHSHESECLYQRIECTNDKCTTLVMRKDLQDHLKSCAFHAMECPNGCGFLMVTPEDTTHNCITELKTAMDILRSEISCKYDEQKREMELKYDEQKREMELRLNMQRSHMVQKEATMQSQIEDLKSAISKFSQKLKLMMDLEIQRRQDVEKLELEKKELMEVLRGKRDADSSSASVSHCKRCAQFSGKVTTI